MSTIKKKEKIRIVFNCSLKYRGISLNDKLLQGPDLTNNLFGVLSRFRENEVGVLADIQKMFYQVKVPSSQTDFLRLFWLNSDNEISQYRLKVHVFGATSSPSVANFALKQAATDFANDVQVEAEIKNNFYVDDHAGSYRSESEAIDVVGQIKESLKKGGFNLTQFKSNSGYVTECFSSNEEISSDIPVLVRSNVSPERALGVMWELEGDEIGFQIVIDDKIVSKRELLSNVASLYDPLGLLTPVLLGGKKLFQESCRSKCSWNDPLPQNILDSYKEWATDLLLLYQYKIPRCLSAKVFSRVELHIFTDGGELAFGSVAFLRFGCEKDLNHVSLACSKSRLTPLNNKTLKTIPRIELCAAKLGVELSLKLQGEFRFEFSQVCYWTDSQTVLQYLKNDHLKFKTFVENKVCFIKNFTDESQWRYVPSKQNPADLVTRGTSSQTLINSELWNNGPRFLKTNEMPPQPVIMQPSADEELKSEKFSLCTFSECSPTDTLIDSTSNWYKLVRRVAYLRKFISYLKNKNEFSDQISVADIKSAERIIVILIQKKYFGKDIKNLNESKNLSRNSLLR